MGAPPVAEKATRASGSGRQMTQPRRRQGRCRIPQQDQCPSPTKGLTDKLEFEMGVLLWQHARVVLGFVGC